MPDRPRRDGDCHRQRLKVEIDAVVMKEELVDEDGARRGRLWAGEEVRCSVRYFIILSTHADLFSDKCTNAGTETKHARNTTVM